MITQRQQKMKMINEKQKNDTMKVNVNYEKKRAQIQLSQERLKERQTYLSEHAKNMSDKIRIRANNTIPKMQNTIKQL